MITVLEVVSTPEPDIEISSNDAELIKRVAHNLGKIEAMRVTRWLTSCGLKTAKDFVESFCASPLEHTTTQR